MPHAALSGGLLALAVWGLAATVLLPVLGLLPAVARPSPLVRFRLSRALAAASCLALAAASAMAMAGLEPWPLEWWPGLPGDPWTLGIDALAAPFLLLLGVLGAASFAAHRASSAHHDVAATVSGGDLARITLHAAFVLALVAAFAARHALLFLVAWEGMTLLSAALVAADPRSARARNAAFTYLALSHAGAAFIAVALLRLAGDAGSFAFTDLAAALARLPAAEADRVVWALTLGFAVKLGLAPLHVWLPMAHPEAPAPVSALLSGSMVKAGLYGLLRFAWQMHGGPIDAWGEVMLVAGCATALIGALYAVLESDAKRVLAWSTVKNAGMLAITLGLAATFTRGGQPVLAGIALAACLYHAVGHGLSKGLAFLSVGEAAHAAGSRDLERLGGLARRLPRLSMAALVAVLALAGLPLLGCFAGEWLLYQALIVGFSAGTGSLRLLAPFVGGGLALATALSLAALVKLYGVGFLGRARSEEAARAHPAGPLTEWTLLALAALGVAWGAGATWALAALAAPLRALLPGFESPSLSLAGGLVLAPLGPSVARMAPLAQLLLVLVAAALPLAWLVAARLRTPVRRAPSWACGTRLDAHQQYSALGFTKPLRLIFGPLVRAERELEVLEEGSPWAAPRMRYRTSVPPLVERVFYQPLVQAVLWTSEQARRLQAGHLHVYMLYLLVTLVVLLIGAMRP
jgi:hydrogenase-4 component B